MVVSIHSKLGMVLVCCAVGAAVMVLYLALMGPMLPTRQLLKKLGRRSQVLKSSSLRFYLILIFAGTLVFWCVAVNLLNAVSVHPALARSRHLNVRLAEDVFAVVIALVVTLSIKWVGILLINALLILPAASSRNISENMREYHLFSVIFSVFSGMVGLFVSYYTNVATGPMIVIVASVIYFATYLYGKNR